MAHSLPPFEMRIQVLPTDIDQLEHVNNVVYVRWIQDLASAHWHAHASEEAIKTYFWVVVRHEIDYIRSAKLDDEIIGRTWVGEAHHSTFERHCELLRASDGKLLAKSVTLWCPISAENLRPIEVSDEVRDQFSVN